jgi:hypothetical protein
VEEARHPPQALAPGTQLHGLLCDQGWSLHVVDQQQFPELRLNAGIALGLRITQWQKHDVVKRAWGGRFLRAIANTA